MMTRYELIIYWSDADQAYVVEVPELLYSGAMRVTRTCLFQIGAASRLAAWI